MSVTFLDMSLHLHGIKMTDQELAFRLDAINNAVASQRLEGLEADPQAIAELKRAAAGELSVADVIDNVMSRFAAGEFRKA
jgi:hypothetical protein